MPPIKTYTVHTPHLLITPTPTPLPHSLTHYISHTIPTITVHTTIPTPPHMRPGHQSVTHCDTIRLKSPLRADVTPPSQAASTQPTYHLYLNDLLIDLTIQILHRSSPYHFSRHYVSPTFTNQLLHQDRDLTTHTRQFEQPLGPDKSDHGHTYILIPNNITTTHWIMLIRHQQPHTKQLLSHNPYNNSVDLTAIESRLTLFDRNNKPVSPLRSFTIVSR